MIIMKSDISGLFLQPDWPAPACVKAYTTLRSSGVGERLPGSEVVNRVRLKSLLTLPDEPVWLTQKHTATVVKASTDNRAVIADASFTDLPKQVCVVLTADCLPVLMTHRDGTHVAAIHAGWRGLANGILEATLRALNIPAKDVLVWLGPAIGPQHFEVRKDVYDIFTQQHAEAKKAFTLFADEHWLADIYELARLRLKKEGVNEIYGGTLCTHSDQKSFFSYRRDGKNTGRLVSLIWIEDSSANL
jgi:YfiH family protein